MGQQTESARRRAKAKAKQAAAAAAPAAPAPAAPPAAPVSAVPEGVEIGSVDTFLDDIRDGRQLGAVDGCLSPGRHAVAQGPANLRRQLVVETVDEVTDMVGDVAEVEVLAPPVARVEDLLEILTGGDDRLVLR